MARRSLITRTSSVRGAGVGLVVIVGALVASWAIAIGRYGGPDEPAHVVRAAAVADGQWRGDTDAAFPPGYRVVSVPARLASGDPTCYRHDARLAAVCAEGRAIDGELRVATSAGIYPPAYYALIGLPARLLGDPASSAWYRAIAVAWNLLLVGLIAVRLRPFGRGALCCLATITPAAWFLLGVVNPNGMEILLAALAWVGVARLLTVDRNTAADVLWVSAPIAIAVLIRPVALLPFAAIAAVVLASGGLHDRRDRAWLGAPVAAAAGATWAWSAWVGAQIDDPRTAEPAGTWSALRTSFGGLPSAAGEVVGSMGWLEFTAPSLVQVVWWVGIAVLAIATWHLGARRLRWAMAAWLGALIGGPIAFEVVMHHRVGFIWQGRYSISTLLGLGALALAARVRLGHVAAIGVLLAGATAEIFAFWSALRRYVVGTDGSWWFDEPAKWQPVIDPVVLLVAHTVVIGVAVAVAVRLLDVAEDVDDQVGRAVEVEQVELPAGAELQVGLIGHGHAGPRVHGRREGAE